MIQHLSSLTKSTDIDWIGNISTNWALKRFKFLSTLPYGDSLSSENRIDGEVKVYGSNGVVGMHERANTTGKTIIIGRKGSYGKINFSNDSVFAIDTTFFIDRSCTRENIDWLYYLLCCLKLDSFSKDSAVPGLAREDAYEKWCPAPPIEDQEAIATYLKRETARIDSLVAKKQKLMELLEEERLAIITQAVTRGLHHNIPMKESGIEWLDKVPAHWQIKALKRIARRIDVGIAEAATHAYADTGVPIIRTTNVAADYIDTNDIRHIDERFAEKNRSKYLYAGDLLTVRTGVPGTTAVVQDELNGSQCFTMLMTTLEADMVPKYFSAFLNSQAARGYFETESWGTAQNNISVPILGSTPVVVPPPSEQKEIAEYVSTVNRRNFLIVSRIRNALEMLKEFRSSIITNAITGKIDVRGVKPEEAAA